MSGEEELQKELTCSKKEQVQNEGNRQDEKYISEFDRITEKYLKGE